jgi:hypothetical protein
MQIAVTQKLVHLHLLDVETLKSSHAYKWHVSRDTCYVYCAVDPHLIDDFDSHSASRRKVHSSEDLTEAALPDTLSYTIPSKQLARRFQR